jgi:restriction system protein
MAVPDFQSLMLPLLKMASDGGEHSLAEAREALAVEFKLSPLDREERLPSFLRRHTRHCL